MRFEAIGEIACDAYVQRPIRFAGEDVDHRLLHLRDNVPVGDGVDPGKNWVPAFAGTTADWVPAFAGTTS